MYKYLNTIRIPLIVLILNALIYQLVHIGFGYFGPILFNSIRIIAIVSAAWLLVEKNGYSIASASFVGPFFLFIDHVLLGGGLGLITTDFTQINVDGTERLLFENMEASFLSGIFVSFLMFFPVSIIFGALGGYLAKNGSQGEAT